MKWVEQQRGYVKEVTDDWVVIQSDFDKDFEVRIPNRVVRIGPGIIAGPGFVFRRGWYGWLVTFEDGKHGFMPDSGLPV